MFLGSTINIYGLATNLTVTFYPFVETGRKMPNLIYPSAFKVQQNFPANLFVGFLKYIGT